MAPLVEEMLGRATPLTIDPTIVDEDAKLTASDAAARDTFGLSVSISGDTVVVGAVSGSAYVFEKPIGGWSGPLTETAKLTASDAFGGISVSISGDTVVVGVWDAPCAAGFSCGSAYVFEKPHERLVGCPD